MPTHEDLLLLNLLWEKQLLPGSDVRKLLTTFYQEASRNSEVSLANVLKSSQLIPTTQILRLQHQASAILQRSLLPELSATTIQECHREQIQGTSSLGITYRVNHPQLGVCALKCLEGVLAKNKKFLQKFLTSLDQSRHIRHENLASLYLVDVQRLLILREFVIGESLETLAQQGIIAPEDAAGIIWQACCGLQAADQNGLLHKNLKPANIILSPSGEIKLVDWSLPPTVPDYLSPEQCENKRADLRSDIYALGVTFYRMIAGRSPFPSANSREIIAAHLSASFPSLAQLGVTAAPEINAIATKMMARQPEDRYQTYAELLADLDKVVSQPEPNGGEATEAAMTALPTEEVRMLSRPAATDEPLEAIAAEEEHVFDTEPTDRDESADHELMAARPLTQEIPDEPLEAIAAEEEVVHPTPSPAPEELPAQPPKASGTLSFPAIQRIAPSHLFSPQHAPDQAPAVLSSAPIPQPEAAEISTEPRLPFPKIQRFSPVTPTAPQSLPVSEPGPLPQHKIAQPETEHLAVETDVTTEARQTLEKPKLSHPMAIPISSKPIPQFHPSPADYANTTPPQEEEWGPGLKGDQPSKPGEEERGSALKRDKNKLVPYFKKDVTEKQNE